MAATSAPIAHPDAVVDAARVAGGAIQLNRLTGDARPKYVDINAALANLDSDADPDGWRADVVLFDHKDRPVALRAQAKFELVIRVSTAEHIRFVNADIPPLRWSMPLEFDEDAVARVKLPLRETLRPVFGWSSATLSALNSIGRHRSRAITATTFVGQATGAGHAPWCRKTFALWSAYPALENFVSGSPSLPKAYSRPPFRFG